MADFSEAPPIDIAALMPRIEAETAIAGFDARIAALEAKKSLVLLGNATLGETTVLSLNLGVRRYTIPMVGAAVGDRLVTALTGAPQNGSVQDAYVPSSGNANIGVLVPALGIGATIAVPVAIYKVV